ncbi:MAG: TylF/MycF/NovP-related O-methyltransferase [Nitrospirota bacterium]
MLKQLLLKSIDRAGYVVLRKPTYQHLKTAAQEGYLPMSSLSTVGPSLDEPGDDTIQDYQAEMHKYHVRTGTKDMDADFLPIYEKCRRFTMTSADRMYALYKAVEYIERASVPGDIVECGVWKGGSMMVAAHTLLRLGQVNRHLYLFDTYEGLPKPDEKLDVDIWGNRGIDGWLPHRRTDESSDWALATLDEVQGNLEGTGYPRNLLHFIKGMVERTIPDKAPEAIALLRLDTDWYNSTLHEMVHLFPRLSRNGVIIIDDYGHFRGARKAVDEYIARLKLPILLNRVDYAGRIAIKNF